MSLSEQIQRVDGSQNDILKALVQSYGIKIAGLKIDQIAAAVKASQKFKQDGLLSDATAALFGLPANSAPDDVFKKIKESFDTVKVEVDSKVQVVNGSYVGTGSSSKTIILEEEALMLFMVGFSPTANQGAGQCTGVTTLINGQKFCLGFTMANWGPFNRYETVAGEGLKVDWNEKSVTITGPDKYYSLDKSDHSYQYVAILK